MYKHMYKNTSYFISHTCCTPNRRVSPQKNVAVMYIMKKFNNTG